MTKKSKKNQYLETLSIHAGTPPDPTTGARVMPIHQSTAYVLENAEKAAALFSLKEFGNIYGRMTNPTVSALEARLTAMEGGVAAVCTSSGLSAHVLAMTSLLQAGDHVVVSDSTYGGTHNQFKKIFQETFGWKTTFAAHSKPDSFKKALRENTKAIFVESLGNPAGTITDIEALAKIADKAGLPLLVDNTMATPYLCRPLDYGATMVTYSTTKFLNGHGNAMGGAVIDGGTFPWSKYANKYPGIAKEKTGPNNKTLAQAFGPLAFAVHNRAVGLRDLGMCQQPMNAWLTLVGIETLPLRMQRHCENALVVAAYLQKHKTVSWVSYAGLKSSPYHLLAKKYMRGQGGAVFTFGLKGGFKAGVKFVESLKLFSHLAHIGDTRSMVIHPASTTHSQLSPEARKAAGAGDDTVRLSIGIEHIDDIIGDIDQALSKAGAKSKA